MAVWQYNKWTTFTSFVRMSCGLFIWEQFFVSPVSSCNWAKKGETNETGLEQSLTWRLDCDWLNLTSLLLTRLVEFLLWLLSFDCSHLSFDFRLLAVSFMRLSNGWIICSGSSRGPLGQDRSCTSRHSHTSARSSPSPPGGTPCRAPSRSASCRSCRTLASGMDGTLVLKQYLVNIRAKLTLSEVVNLRRRP